MPNHQEPLISKAEWDALNRHHEREWIDVYYPIRVWYLLLTCALYAAALIHSSHHMARLLATDHTLVDRLDAYLLFRGWFIVAVTTVGLWAYARDRHIKFIFWGLFFMSLANLISDLFIVYPERLSHPTPVFLLMFTLRMIGIAALFFCAKNTHRLPDATQRFNAFLPLQHGHWFDHHNGSSGHPRG
jgi:hypothetical protein